MVLANPTYVLCDLLVTSLVPELDIESVHKMHVY